MTSADGSVFHAPLMQTISACYVDISYMVSLVTHLINLMTKYLLEK